MARTKHRKGHKEASARRSAYNRLMTRIESAGQPVEVGRNRFKVLPDFEEDVTITVDGQTVPATITNDGTNRLESGPAKGSLLQVDYAAVEQRVLGQMLSPENFVINARGAGKTQELKNFIAQAEAAGRTVIMADVMKQELREKFGADIQEDGETLHVSVPRGQLSDVVDYTKGFYSMGCDCGVPGGDSTVVVENIPKRGPARILDYVSELRPYPEELKRLESYPIPLAPPMLMSERAASPMGCIAPDHVCEPASSSSSHLELGWHLDAEGKPVFDEVSLCPGPDPNGLTTLRDPETPQVAPEDPPERS